MIKVRISLVLAVMVLILVSSVYAINVGDQVKVNADGTIWTVFRVLSSDYAVSDGKGNINDFPHASVTLHRTVPVGGSTTPVGSSGAGIPVGGTVAGRGVVIPVAGIGTTPAVIPAGIAPAADRQMVYDLPSNLIVEVTKPSLLAKLQAENAIITVSQKQFDGVQKLTSDYNVVPPTTGGSQAFVLTKKDDRRVGADNIAILPDGGRTEAVNKGGQTLNKEYLPNGEFKESHLVIAGQDILPFNSEKWTLSETKDGKRELSYNGKKVDETKIDKINKKLEFEDGSYVREFDGGLLVEQKATGETVITERGKKPITLSKKDAEKILKNDKAVLTTSYVANLDDMLDIAEKARVPTSSLEWDGKDSLVSKDVRITAHAGGAAYEKGTFDKGVLDTSKPFTKVDYVMVDGKPVVQKTEILEKDAKAPSVVIWDEKNDVVEVDGQKFTITKDKNVVMFCDGDKCIDLDNSQTYKKTDKGFDRCGKECDELEKKMKKHIEERRVKSGGQKNSERRMTGLFNILETSQTGLGKVFSLFMKEEDKIEWQVKLDKFLCDSYILGGKDCWTSQICSSYIDKIPDSILLIESPTGVQISALVSGVRQEISYAERGTGKKEYVYKLSFAVKNKKDSGRKIRFNVRLEGDKNILLYDTYQEVEEGSIFSRSGKKVIIKESDSFYNKICILFPDGVTKPGEGIINELCNSIVPSPDIGAEQGSTQGNNEGEPEGGEADF